MYDSAILIRLQTEILETLKEVASARQEHVSSFARRAIMNELGNLGFLDDQQRKALGISEDLRPPLRSTVAIDSRRTK